MYSIEKKSDGLIINTISFCNRINDTLRIIRYIKYIKYTLHCIEHIKKDILNCTFKKKSFFFFRKAIQAKIKTADLSRVFHLVFSNFNN